MLKLPGLLLLWLVSEACQTSTSVLTGRLQMAAYPLDKQTAGCNPPYDWLMSLAMDLTALYDMWR